MDLGSGTDGGCVIVIGRRQDGGKVTSLQLLLTTKLLPGRSLPPPLQTNDWNDLTGVILGDGSGFRHRRRLRDCDRAEAGRRQGHVPPTPTHHETPPRAELASAPTNERLE